MTGRINDRLESHFGQSVVFKDVFSIPYGTDYRAHLANAFGTCEVLIAVIGPTWLSVLQSRLSDAQDWVRLEISTALDRDIPVIPLLVNGASVPFESELPDSLKGLASRNAAKAGVDPYFNFDMHHLLIPRLEEIVGPPERAKPPSLPESSASALPSFQQVKLTALSKRKEVLVKQYQAAFQQYNGMLSAADKIIIEEQISMFEKELYQVEYSIISLMS